MMTKVIVVSILLIGLVGIQQANAFSWYLIDQSSLCEDCVAVEPNSDYIGYYQVHYLKHGEQPTFYNYNCLGCDLSDYAKIYNETGLWYWPHWH